MQREREQQRAAVFRRHQQTRDILALLLPLAGAVHHARAAGDRHRAGDQGGAGLCGGAHGGAEPGAALLDERAGLPRRGRGWREAPQPRRDGSGCAGRGAAAIRSPPRWWSSGRHDRRRGLPRDRRTVRTLASIPKPCRLQCPRSRKKAAHRGTNPTRNVARSTPTHVLASMAPSALGLR